MTTDKSISEERAWLFCAMQQWEVEICELRERALDLQETIKTKQRELLILEKLFVQNCEKDKISNGNANDRRSHEHVSTETIATGISGPNSAKS